MKLCGGCNTEKPFAEFNRNRAKKDGYQNWCRACLNPISTAWKKTPIGRASVSRTQKHVKRNPKTRKAQQVVSGQVKRGKMTRQPCCVCNQPNADAHHEDYSRPLDLVWLCDKHHKQRHVAIQQGIALQDSF